MVNEKDEPNPPLTPITASTSLGNTASDENDNEKPRDNAAPSSGSDSIDALDEKKYSVDQPTSPGLKERLHSASAHGKNTASAAASFWRRSRVGEHSWAKAKSRAGEENTSSDSSQVEDHVDDVPRGFRLGKLHLRAEEDDEPQDWWFASTAIPLIAATAGPLANVLSICALVTSWRNNIIEPTSQPSFEETSQGYPDPHWCIALNIASLVCGFVGNLFLLFNFTKAVRYIIALPMTIILWYFATGILTALTISMNKYVPPGENQIYSQGFWHAIIASCLYMFCSMILMVNMLGYFLGHYPQHFTLTDDQRNLILQTMMFFIWLAGGGAIFANTNDMKYPDAVYFCDVTILTIGFGDFHPNNDVSRGLVFPYSVGGIIILGLVVSSIHKFARELSQDNVIKKHVDRKRHDTLSRTITLPTPEPNPTAFRNVDFRSGQRPSISSPMNGRQLHHTAQGVAAQDQAGSNSEQDRRHTEDLPHTNHTHPNSDIDQIQNRRAITFSGSTSPTRQAELEPVPSQFMKHRSHSRRGVLHQTFRVMTAPARVMSMPIRRIVKASNKKPKVLIMREEKDRFDAMRDIQRKASRFKKWYALTISVIAFGILWCVGAIGFWKAEKRTQHLSYFEALYFCYVSLLTVGYGDLSPQSNAGKPLFIVWSLIAVPTMTILISDMGDTVIDSFKRGTFTLADWTILPKKGIYRTFMQRNPWLLNWLQRRAEKKRLKAGFEIGPEEVRQPTLEQLAEEQSCSEAALARQLAFAIRQTADDLKHHSNRKYSYEEWVKFTRLIRFTRDSTESLLHDEEEHGVIEWDWIGDNSPLLSDQSETEWVLDRLCESLLRLLSRDQLTVRPDVEARDRNVLSEEIAEEYGGENSEPSQPGNQSIDEPLFRSIDNVIEAPGERIERSGTHHDKPSQSRQNSGVDPRHRFIGLFPELDVESESNPPTPPNVSYEARPSVLTEQRHPSDASGWSQRTARGRRRSSAASAVASGITPKSPTARKGPFRNLPSGGRRSVGGPSSGETRTLKARMVMRNT